MNASAEAIARACGLRRAGREFTGKCPNCGYKTGFAVADRKGGLPLVYCHAGGCSQQDLIEALRTAGLWPDERDRGAPHGGSRKVKACIIAQARPDPDDHDPTPDLNAEAALAIWRRAVSAAGTPAETYLRFRGYTGPVPPSLRFARGKHPSDGLYHPMLVGAVVLEGRMDRGVAVHRTFLKQDGLGKADLDPNKMTLGGCKGGAVPLAPLAPILAISEGIESGLSYMAGAEIGTWAALSANGIRNLILPEIVRQVVLAVDPDPVGLMAARFAARRWLAEGRHVSFARPPVGLDFNDLARAGR
jgi:putative DNA primase/helicase